MRSSGKSFKGDSGGALVSDSPTNIKYGVIRGGSGVCDKYAWWRKCEYTGE